jgi:hypothetical protein
MPKPEIYISVDVEADGPIPFKNSMLALGAAAFERDKRTPISTFYAKLEPFPGAVQDPKTMQWWAKNPKAWEEVLKEPQPPLVVMRQFFDWVRKLPGSPVPCGYPVSYDCMWVYWYLEWFLGESPFGFPALDIKTLAMDRLKLPFRQTSKRRFPKRWFEGAPAHTHVAVEDAIGQGILLINILSETC